MAAFISQGYDLNQNEILKAFHEPSRLAVHIPATFKRSLQRPLVLRALQMITVLKVKHKLCDVQSTAA